MRDDDRLLDIPGAEFGSGIVGVCDICGRRQAAVILTKERFRLCVIDFLNKSWLKTDRKASAPEPVYRTERIAFETTAFGAPRSVPALTFSPTKVVRRPGLVVTPDTFGITTTVLDAALRFAHEGFEVIVPDVGKTAGIGPAHHVTLHAGAWAGGVPLRSAKVAQFVALFGDALRVLAGREMIDAGRLGAFGTSYGASLAVALAAENPTVRAVAGAYPMPVKPAETARLVTVPSYFVLGGRDRVARRVADQWGPLLGAGTFVTIDGVRHHFLSRDLGAYDLPRAEEAWAGIVRFLKAQLFPPVPKPPPPPVKFPVPDPVPAAASAAPA